MKSYFCVLLFESCFYLKHAFIHDFTVNDPFAVHDFNWVGYSAGNLLWNRFGRSLSFFFSPSGLSHWNQYHCMCLSPRFTICSLVHKKTWFWIAKAWDQGAGKSSLLHTDPVAHISKPALSQQYLSSIAICSPTFRCQIVLSAVYWIS